MELVENYGDWVPPIDVREIVERLVKSVSEKHLAGLGSIVLTTTAVSNRSFHRKKVKHRGLKRSKIEANGSYVQISSRGPSALDFHIAYYIGKLVAVHPDAYFHIISKVKGFDPLVKHLKDQKIFVRAQLLC